MIKTYIFGTPHGFDFYENDEFYKSYFMGFYRSSHQGRRLVVNRRISGETVYTFLQYGLMEKQGRPNSYFGMSMVCKSGYTAEFKKLYEWFCFIFDKLLARGVLFEINGGGNTQYKIAKFQEAFTEIDWVKSQLPNIFSSNANTPIISYNNSFSWKKTGKVYYHNVEDDLDSIVGNFKIGLTIALSESFEKSISVDYNEMADLLGDVHEKLLPIAVNLTVENSTILKTLKLEIEEANALLDKYIPTISSTEEKEQYIGLSNKIKSANSNISQLISKCEKPQNTQVCSRCGQEKSLSEFKADSNVCISCSTIHPVVRKCSECKRTKDISEFEHSTDTICIECKSRGQKNKVRKCVKCNRNLPLDSFEDKSNVCRNCLKKDDIVTLLLEFANKNLKVIFVIAAIFIVTIIIATQLIPKKDNPSQIKTEELGNGIVGNEELTEEVTDENIVDNKAFDGFCSSNNFEQAFTAIKGKDNEDEYKGILKQRILDVLSSFFEATSTNTLDAIAEFKLAIPICIRDLVLDEEFKKYQSAAEQYSQAMALLQQQKPDINDLQEAATKLGEYKGSIPAIESLINTINEKISFIQGEINRQGAGQNNQGNQGGNTSRRTSITYYVQDTTGQDIVQSEKTTTENIGFDCREGEYVVINYPKDTQISFKKHPRGSVTNVNDKRAIGRFRWKVAEGIYIFTCNNIQITITCINNFDTL